MTVQDVYAVLDAYASFGLQEEWDHSGLLVGDPAAEVTRVMLTLDITAASVKEAAEEGAELIISHHPVIFDPIQQLTPAHPVWHLAKNGIAAICAHTNIDIADGGLNDWFGMTLQEVAPFAGVPLGLQSLPGGRTLGRTATLAEPCTAEALAARLKEAFHSTALRYYAGKHAEEIQHIAWCTGSGSGLIHEACAAGAELLITGDCRHSAWVEAQNCGLTLIDIGHYESEVIVTKLFEQVLQSMAPDLPFFVSKTGTAPFFSVLE